MGIRDENKSHIVCSGITMTVVADRLYHDYDWSRSVPDKFEALRCGTLRYGEVMVEMADVLD